ncbi:VQ motif-containing protein 8, chloroplastic-like [Neltuma alba]|uniref:VQ motif-containing protein 8, chloroplastic-like n=1 Tax=Neltuma alba TaxID=207710 RepID=UPI0010A48512|nr:VQ motif-containing protein 8, chloroplastic-like [Prosopis alba]
MTPPSSNFHGFQHQRQSRDIIKGPRPSPLMIKRTSHSIRKPSSSSFTQMTAAAAMNNPKAHHGHLHHHHQQQQQIRKPVIIYTHSPKTIHTKPEDFMALVQKLTGKPRPKDKKEAAVSGAGTENLESSLSDESIISSIKQEKIGSCDVNNEITSSPSSALNRCTTGAADLNYADIPLFTPNSSDFWISPYNRSVFNKQSSADSPFSMLGSLISPSGLEFIKELPEY